MVSTMREWEKLGEEKCHSAKAGRYCGGGQTMI
jgi:hypothetical protein